LSFLGRKLSDFSAMAISHRERVWFDKRTRCFSGKDSGLRNEASDSEEIALSGKSGPYSPGKRSDLRNQGNVSHECALPGN
jgi:hypothetical protein